MTKTVVAVSRGAEFKEIVALMRRWRVTAVPVVEHDGRVVGVVSQADLLVTEEFREHGPGMMDPLGRLATTAKAAATRADDLMTAPAVTIGPDATLPQASRLMADHRVKRLPVVDAAGILEGIVSRCDLLKVFLRSDHELAAEVRREAVVPLLPAARRAIRVSVTDGIVTFRGHAQDSGLFPLATHLARTIEGVVDARCELTASR